MENLPLPSHEVLLMVSLVTTGLLLFIAVYFMVTLSDLESDYINSRTCAASLNRWSRPRLSLLLLHCLLLLPSPRLLLPALPPALWLAHRAWRIPPGNSGLYEPTEIHTRPRLRAALTESLVYMGYHMASFFLYMWLLVGGLDKPEGPPIPGEVPW